MSSYDPIFIGMTKLTPGLQRLRELIKADQQMTVAKAAEYTRQASIEVSDLLPFADFSHPPEDGYGRKMAIDGGYFEIMVMSWNPGDFSSVHDHGHTIWGAVQVFGNVLHHTFTNASGPFRVIKKEILPSESIIRVNNQLIHQMGNITTDPYLTMHLYGNSQRSANITADSRIFELDSGLIKRTTGGAFFNLPDDTVYDVEKMPEVDHETLVHQASILLQYYQRYDASTAKALRNSIMDKLVNYQFKQ